MNIIFFRLMLASLLLMALPFAGSAAFIIAKNNSHEVKQLWTCGMHPQVMLEQPGDCPICHMKLVPLHKTMADDQNNGAVMVSPAAVQNMNLRTGVVLKGPVRYEIRTVGMIVFDETSLADVTTKVKGWVEKLYVDYTGSLVHKGEPLFEIYAPELYNAQIEYLLARRQTATGMADALAASTLTKLQFLDVSTAQIAALEKSGKPRKTIAILSPRDGTVVEKNVVSGQMVEAGTRLYRIADLSTVWVLAQVYERDLPYVKLGQAAEIAVSYLNDRKYHGRVTYIYPTVDEASRTVKVRLEFHNPGYSLKPGMYVTAVLQADIAREGLLVPEQAVVRSGALNTVFVVRDGGRYEPREVILGPRVEHDMYQVLSGLGAGEKIVTSGQFMLDSESQLRSALQRLKPAGGKEIPPLVADRKVSYVCPMPEHASVTYKEPGKCSLCGMTLVPITAEQHRLLQLDKPILYYTCPMPEHADVHESKPGKCPKCGMTLIPVTVEPKEKSVVSPVYVCPMDPEIHSDKPGHCPKCGMNLVLEKK